MANDQEEMFDCQYKRGDIFCFRMILTLNGFDSCHLPRHDRGVFLARYRGGVKDVRQSYIDSWHLKLGGASEQKTRTETGNDALRETIVKAQFSVFKEDHNA